MHARTEPFACTIFMHLFRSIPIVAAALPLAALGSSDPSDAIGDTIVLEPFVVTTTHLAAPLVSIADPKAPAQPVPAHDGADVLKSIPGFSVIRKGGADGDPVLRGLAGSRLGIQVDGEHIFGGCGNRMDPPTAYVFPAAYDRITVIKGPQTVIHGPGNSAGVVLFERDRTRPTGPFKKIFASATAASFRRFDANLDAGAGNPIVQARLAVTTTRADDFEDGDGRDVHSSYERWSINASGAWTPDDRTWVEFATARSDGEAAYADRSMDGVKFARENYSARLLRTEIGPLVAEAELRAYYNYVDHVMDNFSLRPFVPTMTMPGRAVSNPDRLTTGGLAQLVLTPAESVRVTAGIDTQRNVHTVRSTSNETTAPFAAKPRVRDARFAQAGVFAEAAITLSEDRRFFAGARLDRWRVTDSRSVVAVSMMGTVPNPGAGHTRRSELASGFVRFEQDVAARTATLFAGVGRVQRFPDYWELIKNESATGVTALGTAPETTTQFDAGVVWRKENVEFTLSAFASAIEDFILVQSGFAKPAGMMGTRSAVITRNVDASTFGGEAGLVWRFAPGWKLDGSLSYVRGRNRTDSRPLAQMPPLEGRVALAYERSSWSAGVLVRAAASQNRIALNQGNIVGQDIGPSDGFAVCSINASWKPTPATRLSAGVDNVFDTTYAEHISRSGASVAGYAQTTRVNEPGRNLWVQFQISY
jgi:iron complex outermembrane receptor protein